MNGRIDAGPRRGGVAEEAPVDFVHLAEVAEIGEIDRQLDHLVEAAPGGFPQLRLDGPGPVAVGDTELLDLLAVESGQPRGEGLPGHPVRRTGRDWIDAMQTWLSPG